MSELQLSLLAVGLLVVGGVVVFNRIQERNFRRRSEQHFQASHDDVLLNTGAANSDDEAAPEPHEETAGSDETDAEQARERPRSVPSMPDDTIDFAVKLYSLRGVPGAEVCGQLRSFEGISKPLRGLVYDSARGAWEEASGAGTCCDLALAVQLVDRAGALSEQELDAFCRQAQELAQRYTCSIDIPGRAQALDKAVELDAFCGQVDVQMGVNVVARDRTGLKGSTIKEEALAYGMVSLGSGEFGFYDHGAEPLFTLGAEHGALQGMWDDASVPGVTLLFDVPKVANGPAVLERVVAFGRYLANKLGAQLVDDNRQPISDAAVGNIARQLEQIYAAMDTRCIAAGSPQALRLFS
ncbi:MAG: cell division protein ZipA C-terminal FtsZ-binding domain-containing protein [Burkholderiales bacterium]